MRYRLEHHEAVALASRREHKAQCPRERALDDVADDEAGRLDDALEPVLADRCQHLRALGAIAVDHRA